MKITLTVILVAMVATSSTNRIQPFKDLFPDFYPYALDTGVDPGQPLFLTPYLEKGEAMLAHKLSRTGDLIPAESYSGFVEVNKTTNSNIFFWFFPSQMKPETDPVVVWLQGGPGASSLFGLFTEIGPLSVNQYGELTIMNITWNSRYSLLFIDNPVGTGFSFTDDTGYVTNQEEVARDLYSFLTQFFQIYTEYQKNDLYITGESYAGKYCPAIAYKIHMENPTAELKMNLKGVAIGNGFSDPETMNPVYGDYMFFLGLLDENERDHAVAQGKQIAAYIHQGLFIEADMEFENLAYDFLDASGLRQMYNYLITKNPDDYDFYPKWLATPEARLALHVGNLEYGNGNVVYKYLQEDIMKSVKPWLAVIMDNYKVMLYSGQLDIIVAHPLTEAMLLTVPWQGKDAYLSADKLVWKVKSTDDEVAGYVRQVDQFFQVIVRDGGHILPHDQPARSLDMLQRFIEDIPFN